MNYKAVSGILSVSLMLTMYSSTAYAQDENNLASNSNNSTILECRQDAGGGTQKADLDEEGEKDNLLTEEQNPLQKVLDLKNVSEDDIWDILIAPQESADSGEQKGNKRASDANAVLGKEALNPAKAEAVAESNIQQAKEAEYGKKEIQLTEELKLMIATVYGEAASCSESSWEAIANVIMNRINYKEWKKYDSVTEVIRYTRFDAATYKNKPFRKAMEYLNNRDSNGQNKNEAMEKLIEIVVGVYNREKQDITGGAVLYYSPRTQKALNKKFPGRYSIKPRWNYKKLEELAIPGTEKDDLKFYRYKSA